jgi:hypothetical protein
MNVRCPACNCVLVLAEAHPSTSGGRASAPASARAHRRVRAGEAAKAILPFLPTSAAEMITAKRLAIASGQPRSVVDVFLSRASRRGDHGVCRVKTEDTDENQYIRYRYWRVTDEEAR